MSYLQKSAPGIRQVELGEYLFHNERIVPDGEGI